MNSAEESGDLEGASLLAIHASIAAADAFTIRHLGVRCASDRHEDAANLLEQVAGVAEVTRAAQHFRRVLMKKD